MFINVDFPDPDGPTTATYSPAPILISIPRNASNSRLPER
jgi:hypothetical protein